MARAPKPLGPLSDHLQMIRRMSAASGVDPAVVAKAGQMTQEDWAEAVRRCRGCNWTDGCARWVNTPADANRETPANCENQAFLNRLLDASKDESPC